MRRIADGRGRLQDLDDLLKIARDMEGKTICVFADAAAWPVQSYITKFRGEFEEHIVTGRCIGAVVKPRTDGTAANV
jgi:NADH-quinone oxidoreductase subunit F